MPAGEIILVAYSQENLFLNSQPQITFFKILYRRYSNFAIETVKQTFKNSIKFGNKYSIEISKLADLLHKMWVVIDLPEIPIVYDFNNNSDNKVKFKWAKDIGYAVIDYVEMEIEGKTITKHWGEFYNCMNKLNWNNFNGSIDEYIGNVPEVINYKKINENIASYSLKIPLNFWFCENSGNCFPLINCEYSSVKFNIKLNDFNKCAIFSPSNYINIQKYSGRGILGEPLLQVTHQGYSWGEFDSIDINSFNKETMDVNSYNLYYRKISDNNFITTTDLNNVKISTSIDKLENYVIYGLYSGSVYIPYNAVEGNASSIHSSKKYFINFNNNLEIKDMYILSDFIYIDNEERIKFYNSKRDYLIDQVYKTSIHDINNLSNKTYIKSMNCCKYLLFMGQVKYYGNNNVNFNFNYNSIFFDTTLVNPALNFFNFYKKNTIDNVNFLYDSSKSEKSMNMDMYSLVSTFYDFKKAENENGFGLKSFSLYPQNSQPSGSMNTSKFQSLEIQTYFNKIDDFYNKYLLRCYIVSYNYLTFTNGVSGTIFTNAY
jgi:hypothetical protein